MPAEKPSKTVKQSSQPTHNLGAEDFGFKDFDSPTESLVVRTFIFTPYPYGPKQPWAVQGHSGESLLGNSYSV